LLQQEGKNSRPFNSEFEWSILVVNPVPTVFQEKYSHSTLLSDLSSFAPIKEK
jgi:hypothetical protein